jgi:hypothetical protein
MMIASGIDRRDRIALYLGRHSAAVASYPPDDRTRSNEPDRRLLRLQRHAGARPVMISLLETRARRQRLQLVETAWPTLSPMADCR